MAKDRIKKKLEVDPDEAEVVRRIYVSYVAGLGAKAIAERLNTEGCLRRGVPWTKNRILDLIGHEAYKGEYYFNRYEKGKGARRLKPRQEWVLIALEPIIDEVTWEKARVLKEQRTPATGHRNPAVTGAKTLLTGLAVCGLCGARMTLETAKAGRYTYYNCGNFFRKGKSACPGQRIPAHSLEQTIIEHMATKLFTTERVKIILRGIYDELREMDKRHDGERKSLIRRLEVVKTKLIRQYEAIESGVIDLHDVAERIRELKATRAQIEARLEELKPPRAIPIHLFSDESIQEFQKTIKELFLGENRPLTKKYLQLFIEKIVITLPRVEVVGKSEVVLAVLENKKAVRTDGILTAGIAWLPGTYRCKNFVSRLVLTRGGVAYSACSESFPV